MTRRIPPAQREQARYLRRNMTDAERLLWEHLRDRQLGVRFRRQHPIGPHIVDFATFSGRVVIEIDSPTHRDFDKEAIRRCRSRETGVARDALPQRRCLRRDKPCRVAHPPRSREALGFPALAKRTLSSPRGKRSLRPSLGEAHPFFAPPAEGGRGTGREIPTICVATGLALTH